LLDEPVAATEFGASGLAGRQYLHDEVWSGGDVVQKLAVGVAGMRSQRKRTTSGTRETPPIVTRTSEAATAT